MIKHDDEQNDASTNILSPCVRNCCLNKHDYCAGCFRHLNEITSWSVMTNYEKEAVLIKCQYRRESTK